MWDTQHWKNMSKTRILNTENALSIPFSLSFLEILDRKNALNRNMAIFFY